MLCAVCFYFFSCFTSTATVKPVLNWANVCSPNRLRTLRRIMIRFLTELLVRRIWFGQFKLYFILNWLVMRCKLRPELRRSRQHDRKCWLKSIYFHHPSQGNSTNYYLILGLRDKVAPPTSQQINKFRPKRVKNLATPSSIFIFSSSTGELCSQPIRGNDRRMGRMFPEHVERSFMDPEYSFDEYFKLASRRKVGLIKNQLASRILQTRFAKKHSPN